MKFTTKFRSEALPYLPSRWKP